jgi:tetratricopeptide (TPR) repeat protein
MVRSITLVAVMCATVAAGAYATVGGSTWPHLAAAWRAGAVRTPDATYALEGWPVCTTMASVAGEVDGLDPDFAAGRRALRIGDWNAAIDAFKLTSLRDPDNADIQNYIGYAYQRLHLWEPAKEHFKLAVKFNRRHRGARQHLGELALTLGEPANAAEQLAALDAICLIPCEEYRALEREIAVSASSKAH